MCLYETYVPSGLSVQPLWQQIEPVMTHGDENIRTVHNNPPRGSRRETSSLLKALPCNGEQQYGASRLCNMRHKHTGRWCSGGGKRIISDQNKLAVTVSEQYPPNQKQQLTIIRTCQLSCCCGCTEVQQQSLAQRRWRKALVSASTHKPAF